MATMNRLTWMAVVVGAMALGCGGGGGASKGGDTKPADKAATPTTGGTHAVPAMTGDVKCYKGDAGIELATGQEMKAEVYLRRAWDAASSTMTEDSVTVAAGNASRSWTTLTAQGGALTVAGKYKGGTFSGTGTATGDGPAWSAWTVETKLDVGTGVKSESKMEGEGISSTSMVAGKDGAAMMKVAVTLAPLDADACNKAFSQWAPL